MSEKKEFAEAIAGKWLHRNQLQLAGTKTVGDYMYVKGFDYGFPHAGGYVCIDLRSQYIIQHYDLNNCPVEVEDGIYE